MAEFELAHEDQTDLSVIVDWSPPVTHDMLYTGLANTDDEAYLYAIIGRFEGDWWSYYIGMTYNQSVLSRQQNQDHLDRLERLKKLHPKTIWHITLGTPSIPERRISRKLIEQIEGLLIYSHWHEESVNEKKISTFLSDSYISILNTGFADPFYTEVAFGTFVSDR